MGIVENHTCAQFIMRLLKISPIMLKYGAPYSDMKKKIGGWMNCGIVHVKVNLVWLDEKQHVNRGGEEISQLK